MKEGPGLRGSFVKMRTFCENLPSNASIAKPSVLSVKTTSLRAPWRDDNGVGVAERRHGDGQRIRQRARRVHFSDDNRIQPQVLSAGIGELEAMNDRVSLVHLAEIELGFRKRQLADRRGQG